jgi:hypothetical protein
MAARKRGSGQEGKVGRPCPVSTDHGVAISSLFSGLARQTSDHDPVFIPRLTATERRCGGDDRESGFVTRLSNLTSSIFTTRIVRASNCIPGQCGAHRFEAFYVECGSLCGFDEYKESYRQNPNYPYCDGWKYDGNTTCALCEDCTEVFCDSCQGQ